MDLKEYIRDIPDFPEPGILFRDITPLLRNPQAFNHAIDTLADYCQKQAFDTIVAIEIHSGDIEPGDRVIVLDDLLATGGTLEAAAQLVEKSQGVVAGIGLLIELKDLGGREKLKKYDIYSLMEY